MGIDIQNAEEGHNNVPIKQGLQSVGIILALYLAFSILLPLHRFDFRHLDPAVRILLVIVPTALFMLLQLLLSVSLVRLKLTSGLLVAVGLLSVLVWLTVLEFFHPYHRVNYDTWLVFRLSRYALLSVFLTISITCFGSLLSLIIKERSLLLPVALIAMPIDYLGAMTPTGFTHDMVEHASKIVSSVSVSVPAVSAHGVSISPIAFIGPGDVLFMAMFFAAVQRFELAERATFWWMYGLLTLSMIIAIRFFPVAALVPMGLAVIVANAAKIKLKREEVFAVLYAGALIIVLVCLFYWSSHKYLFHSH